MPSTGLSESWEALGLRQKSDLVDLSDARGLLRRCHDRLHSRGATEDPALTMTRMLLAKWHDEERPGEAPLFYCTPQEYRTREGRRAAAGRAERLFAEVRDANPTVFEADERIGVPSAEIVDLMIELQPYRLRRRDAEPEDLLGAAYEEYTAQAMKREGGEFFTNPLLADLLTAMAAPGPDVRMLDPAGGTGGFLAAVWRYVRDAVRKPARGKAARRAAGGSPGGRLFLIEKKPRLVKFARAALILAGAGPCSCIQADALQDFDQLPAGFLAQCRPGAVNLVMTNPPWAGLANGRIKDSSVLRCFEVAHRWQWRGQQYRPTAELLAGGLPPEYLFVEQAIKWLRPGGKLALVLPKGLLDNLEPALAVRHYLFRHCRVLAVINCHKNTFQPYTGSRGCLLLAQKKQRPGDARDYPIFMAINRKIGQDSEGAPVYRPDDQGRPTAARDHDLDDLLAAWQAHGRGQLKASEYAFSIRASALDPRTLKLNPQFFLPSLNQSLRRVVGLDGNGFAVERLGDRIAARIWKGTRFKREDLETDTPGPETVSYYPPGAVFMGGEGVKFLDLARCDARRRALILGHRAREGEILLTRSGTLGRVSMVGRSRDGVVLSDDLIRIWVEDPQLRAYVFAFLRSPAGQDQLRRNEYGTVQQHLEPSHVADLLLPLPEGPEALAHLLQTVAAACEAQERSLEMADRAGREIVRLLNWSGPE